MTDWKESIEARTFEFIEELERRGFRADGRTLVGSVEVDSSSLQLHIALTDEFPFAPPSVSPPPEFPRSWHREPEGQMCLYPTEGRESLPWLDVSDFLATISRWISESRIGWTKDFPDLDLERYFHAADEPLVVYPDLDRLNNKFIQLRRLQHLTRVTGPGSVPKGKRLGKDRSFGFVIDIGEPAEPPTSWDSLRAMVTPADAKTIERAVGEGRLEYLVVRYSRGGVAAAMVVKAWSERSGGIGLASIQSASEASATLTLRAGANAERLADVAVAVVGVGAIGSFACDLLGRAGVGTIAAYDPDIVRPGNLIRHVAGPEHVGLTKPDAVKRVVEGRPFSGTTVRDLPLRIPPAREVMNVFAEYDLVIDASGSGGASHLLAAAAIAGGHHLVSVCLQEEGSVVRVDIIPPLAGSEPLPPTKLSPPSSNEHLRFEAGCGDPVSQTPAYAVFEAASLAVRHAVGLLIGSAVSPAGTVRDYR